MYQSPPEVPNTSKVNVGKLKVTQETSYITDPKKSSQDPDPSFNLAIHTLNRPVTSNKESGLSVSATRESLCF